MTTNNNSLYHYKAVVLRVIDGDTIELLIDVGFRQSLVIRARLLNINAPELHKRAEMIAGKKSRDALRNLIDGKDVIIRTSKADDWGRWLVEVWIYGDYEQSVNDWMVEHRHANYNTAVAVTGRLTLR
jgi:micrococcal nuclease